MHSSTGPKTAAGLVAAARNARRHGLAIPVSSDPALSAEAEALAQSIAPEGASPTLLDLARRIAEAQVDIMRVREARRDLAARAFADGALDATKLSKLLLRLAQTIWNRSERRHSQPMDLRKALSLAQEQIEELPHEDLLWNKLKLGAELTALDRYERRAFSRRKSAARAFDAARAAEAADAPIVSDGKKPDADQRS